MMQPPPKDGWTDVGRILFRICPTLHSVIYRLISLLGHMDTLNNNNRNIISRERRVVIRGR